MIHCNPLAVFGLQLVGNNLVLNVDHAGNHMLASTNCGLYGNVSDSSQILHNRISATTFSGPQWYTILMGS